MNDTQEYRDVEVNPDALARCYSLLDEYLYLTLEQYAGEYVPVTQLFWMVLGRLYYALTRNNGAFLPHVDLYQFVAQRFAKKGWAIPLEAAPPDHPGRAQRE